MPAQFQRYGQIGDRVLKNLRRFSKGKAGTADVFDQLNVSEG